MIESAVKDVRVVIDMCLMLELLLRVVGEGVGLE